MLEIWEKMHGKIVNIRVHAHSDCVSKLSAPTVNIDSHRFYSAWCCHYHRIDHSVWNKAMYALGQEGRMK